MRHVLPPRVRLEDARTARDAAVAALPAAGAFELDCSACHDADSSLLSVLLEVLRAARARGVTVTLAGADARLQALAALYGVDELLFA